MVVHLHVTMQRIVNHPAVLPNGSKYPVQPRMDSQRNAGRENPVVSKGLDLWFQTGFAIGNVGLRQEKGSNMITFIA